MYGLLIRDEKNIKEALSKFDEIEEAILFGRRSMGNYKAGSDVDLALKGPLEPDLIIQVSESLNEGCSFSCILLLYLICAYLTLTS